MSEFWDDSRNSGSHESLVKEDRREMGTRDNVGSRGNRVLYFNGTIIRVENRKEVIMIKHWETL